MTDTIAFANQKGGVGKTTTTQNVGAAASEAGVRTLLVDLDPQASLTTACGVKVARDQPTNALYADDYLWASRER